MASLTNQRRVRRPAPRFPLSKVYAWKTVTVKIWWPATGTPPGWGDHAPGL